MTTRKWSIERKSDILLQGDAVRDWEVLMRVTLCSPSAIPHGSNLYRIPRKPIPRYIESSLQCPMKKNAPVEIQKATFHFATHGQ